VCDEEDTSRATPPTTALACSPVVNPDVSGSMGVAI
jgi:hypothetical protein